jgi:hypothetical protein
LIRREIIMFKTVAAAGAAFMIAVGAVAYAQQPPAGPDSGRRQFTPEDRAAFLSARIAALHTGLQLTPEQEKAWPAFEQAYRDVAALRGNRGSGLLAEDLRAGESFDPVQRAQRVADALTTRGVAFKKYADALGPLYQGLDDGQKRRFGILSRLGHRHVHHRLWHGHDREFGDSRGEFSFRRGEFGRP